MKKWKIILCIIVLLLAGGGGTLYYLLNVKVYKIADAKVAKMVKNDYEIKLPDDNGSTNLQGANQKGTNQQGGKDVTAKAGDQTVQVQKIGTSTAVTLGKNATSVQKKSAASIIAEYQPSFKDLESQANSKLDSLLSYAFDEYHTKKAKGEEISYFYFYSKYSNAARTLEANTNASFNVIYNALVKELVQSGYSAKDAEPLKTQYLSEKKQRSSAIMSKAMAYLK